MPRGACLRRDAYTCASQPSEDMKGVHPMLHRKGKGTFLLAFAFILVAAIAAPAQDSDAPRQTPASRPEVNHEVLIHLLVTAEGTEDGGRVPQALEGVVRQ